MAKVLCNTQVMFDQKFDKLPQQLAIADHEEIKTCYDPLQVLTLSHSHVSYAPIDAGQKQKFGG